MQRVFSTVVLLGLLVASAAAFVITEHLKLIKSPIYATHVTKVFSPVCGCATARAEIRFKLRRADSLTVQIVDSAGHEVAALATDEPHRVGTARFFWNGHTDGGAVAPESSSYRPQITFGSGRTILMPNTITLDTVAPKVLRVSTAGGSLVAGSGHAVAITYAFDGHARAAVYVGRSRVVLGRFKRPSGVVKWNGKVGGKLLSFGPHMLEIAAVDAAGNETPPAERKHAVVRIIAIALDKSVIRVAPGARFVVRVRTAGRYTWRLADKRGTGTAKRLHLHAPSKQGRYRLVVSAHGEPAHALVIVRKK